MSLSVLFLNSLCRFNACLVCFIKLFAHHFYTKISFLTLLAMGSSFVQFASASFLLLNSFRLFFRLADNRKKTIKLKKKSRFSMFDVFAGTEKFVRLVYLLNIFKVYMVLFTLIAVLCCLSVYLTLRAWFFFGLSFFFVLNCWFFCC